MGMKTVYLFKATDFKSPTLESKTSQSYGTLHAIERAKGTAIVESAMEIEEAMLDGNEMYAPKAA